MGVSCAGKTSVGLELANSLGIFFIDADDFHPPSNILKMQNGTPLNDLDREPWLTNLNKELLNFDADNKSVVLACSALKDSYRRLLLKNISDHLIIYLSAKKSLLEKRQINRMGHFFHTSLLASQLKILEAPKEKCIELNSGESMDSIIKNILEKIYKLNPSSPSIPPSS
jgi:carbohydrate kinase (thermoresistant glucokinase family)